MPMRRYPIRRSVFSASRRLMGHIRHDPVESRCDEGPINGNSGEMIPVEPNMYSRLGNDDSFNSSLLDDLGNCGT